MNENNEEIMEEVQGEDNLNESGVSATEIRESTEEGDISSDAPEDPRESEILTVSDGDSETLSLILEELQLQNEILEEMQTYHEERDLSLFEKSLSNYTTGEGLMLIILLILLSYLVFHWIGGIIKCET